MGLRDRLGDREPEPGSGNLLLARGARVDEENPETGSTPLNEAASHGNRELVALLLSHGADRNRRDRHDVYVDKVAR